MEQIQRRTDIPVLILHNIDPDWPQSEKASAIDAVGTLRTELQKQGHPVVEVTVTDATLEQILQPYRPEDYIVFNWCEELPGQPRSDDTVARVLERLNFAYTGSSPEVLAFSWDKAATKRFFEKKGISTPSWEVVALEKTWQWELFPAIVKPSYEHCSLGITSDAVVTNLGELKDRIAFVHKNFNQPALIEEFIDGREFHVTLWGNDDIQVLPAAEMDFSAFDNIRDRLCTFDSKFTPGSVHYEKIELRIPAPLDEKQLSCLNRTAIRAYQIMNCRDYARIDLRLDGDVYYVLDVNPNADFSPDTSLAYAAEAAGLSYGVMASWMINLAAQRHPLFSV